MRLALLFAFVALACPPPFNDFRFQGNETVSSASLVEQALADPMFSWMDYITDPRNQPKPWPRDPVSGIHVVEYCFADRAAKRDSKDVVGRAWMKWYNTIRGPSKDSGHSLTFRPAVPLPGDRKEQYCYLLKTNGRGAWNDAFSKNILIIGHGAAGAAATIGWNREDFSNNMEISSTVPGNEIVTAVAHELGHVFGLGHEHQRPDRYRYVRFDCTRLIGYTQLANTPNKPDSMDEICKSSHLGSKYGFIAPQFSTDPFHQQFRGGPVYVLHSNIPQPYDVHSLMHYGSTQGSASYNWWECPLVKWKKGGPNFIPPSQVTHQDIEEIPYPTDVSAGDVDAIRYLYPW